MSNMDAINKAAEKFTEEIRGKHILDYDTAKEYFKLIVESEAAKQYLYEQFKKEQEAQQEEQQAYINKHI